MVDAADRMEVAVSLARSGESEQAQALFSRIVEDEPVNFKAWLWLSELSNDLEDQTAMLEQALKYVPAGADGSRDLQTHLNDIRGCVVLGAAPALEVVEPALEPILEPGPAPYGLREAIELEDYATIPEKRAEGIKLVRWVSALFR